jgi:hypothetical protein
MIKNPKRERGANTITGREVKRSGPYKKKSRGAVYCKMGKQKMRFGFPGWSVKDAAPVVRVYYAAAFPGGDQWVRIPRGAVVTDWRRKPFSRASCRWLIWLCVIRTVTPNNPATTNRSAQLKVFDIVTVLRAPYRMSDGRPYNKSKLICFPRDLVNVPGDQTTTQVQHMLSTSSPTERGPYYNFGILSGE